MKSAVIGLGEFGSAVALGLARNGAEVIAVDTNMERLDLVKDEVALALKFDASQWDAFDAHGLGEVDVLVAAIGNNFEAQVLVVVHAKKSGVKTVVARSTTGDHFRVLEAVGADEVLNPEEEAAHGVVQKLTITNISKYFELADGFSVVEIDAPRALIGKTLLDLDLRRKHRLNLVALKSTSVAPGGERMVLKFNPVPLPDEMIREGDVLALGGSVLDLADFMAEFNAD